jgi:hypothetical protein
MSKRSAADWLSDIVLWGGRLQGHLQGVDRDAFFLSDSKVQRRLFLGHP